MECLQICKKLLFYLDTSGITSITSPQPPVKEKSRSNNGKPNFHVKIKYSYHTTQNSLARKTFTKQYAM